MTGHLSTGPTRAAAVHDAAPTRAGDNAEVWTFSAVYDAHFAFVWRTVRRLGVVDGAVDDVVQDVFLVVHRKISDFRRESTLRSWLFAIASRVVGDSRRTLRRKPGHLGGRDRVADDVALLVDPAPGPYEKAAAGEAVSVLHAILDAMTRERREVFILAELEQMSVGEIAAAVHANANTIYSRLRAARADFERAAIRAQANDQWRVR